LKDALEEEWFVEHLRCPDCGNKLLFDMDVACRVCDRQLPLRRPVDLRPVQPRRAVLEICLENIRALDQVLETIDIGPPMISYNGPPAQRDSRELISEMVKWVPRNGKVLDLGCGPHDQEKPLQSVGYQYLAVDYSSPSADFLVDAHSMPFCGNSFDCIFSYGPRASTLAGSRDKGSRASAHTGRTIHWNGLPRGAVSRVVLSPYCAGAR